MDHFMMLYESWQRFMDEFFPESIECNNLPWRTKLFYTTMPTNAVQIWDIHEVYPKYDIYTKYCTHRMEKQFWVPPSMLISIIDAKIRKELNACPDPDYMYDLREAIINILNIRQTWKEKADQLPF
jgi:hypothetical protein